MIIQPLTRTAPENIHGIELYEPIALLDHTKIGLYDDARFPGRCIVALRELHNSFIDLPEPLLADMMRDVQMCAKAIQLATGCSRVNIALLSNTEPLVHAHLIPRYPERESLPTKSPWDDPRPLIALDAAELHSLKIAIFTHLKHLATN